ncbi:MAG: NifU family protein [Dysosmobacter sp.]
MSDLERIEAAMEEKVRPALRSHGGDISIDHVEGKTVYVKLLGQCAGCPSADLTNETIVEAELKAALPDLVEKAVVVQTVSDELWEQAKSRCGSIICKGVVNPPTSASGRSSKYGFILVLQGVMALPPVRTFTTFSTS